MIPLDPADYALTPADLQTLFQRGAAGPDFEVADNARPGQHVHARRIGEPGSRALGRVAVITHNEAGGAIASVIAAPQARALAAALLNAADEIDGVAPLVFFPRDPEAQEGDE